MFLKKYIETGRSKLINSDNFIIGLHKNNYLLPFEFYLREVSGQGKSTFVAVIKV